MTANDDPSYSKLSDAMNLLLESSAKIDFLTSKIGDKIDYLDDEDIARATQISLNLYSQETVPDRKLSLDRLRDRADYIQTSLRMCRGKCKTLQERVRELIDMKDTIFCKSIRDLPDSEDETKLEEPRSANMASELRLETMECTVCTEHVRKEERIWSCKICFNILHLSCATRCVNATARNGKWDCPVCRTAHDVERGGLIYTCFCGRVSSPNSVSGVTPHSCGQKCIRLCNSPCHPGPCPKSS